MSVRLDLATIAKAVFEAAMVLLAVLLAFLVTEWREDNRAESRANMAIERIVLELENNIAQLQAVAPYHRDTAQAMGEQVALMEAGEVPARGRFIEDAVGVMERGIYPPQLTRNAWDYAVNSGVLDPVDYDVVANLAAAYAIQDSGVNSTWRQMASTMFLNEENMAVGELSPRFQLLALMFSELASQEEYLVQVSAAAHADACEWLDETVVDGRCTLGGDA